MKQIYLVTFAHQMIVYAGNCDEAREIASEVIEGDLKTLDVSEVENRMESHRIRELDAVPDDLRDTLPYGGPEHEVEWFFDPIFTPLIDIVEEVETFSERGSQSPIDKFVFVQRVQRLLDQSKDALH